MKKRVFSVFLISLVLPFIVNCNEALAAGYTYINNEIWDGPDRLRFNTDKTLDFFEDGEWKNINSVILDKNNLNFIFHKSDNPEFFGSFYLAGVYAYEIALGFLSEDGKTLYVGLGFILSKEESGKKSKSVTKSYITKGDSLAPFNKVRFNSDNSFDFFEEGEWNTLYVTWLDKKNRIFISRPDPEDTENVIFGVFSADEKTLCLGNTIYSFELSSPKLTVDSLDVGGITFRSKPEDLAIQFPAVISYQDFVTGWIKDNQTAFMIIDFDGFDALIFVFEKDKLISISETAVQLPEEDENKLPALVQKSVRELTAKYGEPKVVLSSSSNEGHSFESINFTWYGEIIINAFYLWYTDKSGRPFKGTYRTVYYELDNLDEKQPHKILGSRRYKF